MCKKSETFLRHPCDLHFAWSLVLIASVLWGPSDSCGQDFNGDGKPDILWHNQETGTNVIWLMDGPKIKSSVSIQPSTDLNWQIVGTGFFNDDDQRDILWQHRTGNNTAVWLMKGTSYLSSVTIEPAIEAAWRAVGAADFDGDRKSDLVWQHETSGEKAIWLMDGAKLRRGVVIDKESGPDWRIACTGEFGGDPTPDLILRHRKSGALAAWTMSGPSVASNTNIGSIQRPDLDWQLVGAADFDGDGQTDLLWRHATLGLNSISFMKGLTRLRDAIIDSEPDTNWRAASQDPKESRYRLEIEQGICLTAAVTNAPHSCITLASNFSLSNGRNMTMYRRLAGATNWGTPIGTNLTGKSYTDTNVLVGQRYEYRMAFENAPATRATLTAGILAAPIEHPGKIVLLVDQALASKFAAPMNAGLQQVIEDLIGDGWTVARKNVPRHDDRADKAANRANRESIASIKSLLRDEYQSGARGVLIIGHVAIPYSGYHSSDGHTDHAGAWPADMYYGDVDGAWGDEGMDFPGSAHPEHSNVPGDGKWQNDFPPSNLEMFVGRVDFARLEHFQTGNAPSAAEARLVQQYFAKTHRYRFNLPPYPVAPAGIAYSYLSLDGRQGFDAMIFENAQRNFSAFYPEGARRLTVGDVFHQRKKSWQWGFIGGNGSPSAINVNMHLSEHTTASLAEKSNEARVAFCLALGSYFGDWNFSNNLMRAMLAMPNYGLATAWLCPKPTPMHWRFEAMGLGEPLGAGLLATVNDNPPYLLGDNNRLLAILGDPTLRLHILTPPSNLRLSEVQNWIKLTWSPGDSGSEYFIYRSSNRAGPFKRISRQPVAAFDFADTEPSSKEPVYMVRALKLLTSGCGSYTNLSQGVVSSAR